MSEIKTNKINDSNQNIDENNHQDKMTKSLKATILYLISSFGTKIFNIIFGAILFRYITKESYSITKIELEFIYTVIQFIPVTTIKLLFQKYCSDNNPDQEKIKYNQALKLTVKMNIITIILSVPLTLLFVFSKENLWEILIHVFLYWLSSVIEILVEPIICKLNLTLELNKKIIAITTLNYIRIVVSLILAVFFNLDLWCFTIGKILSSIFYCLYLIYIYKSYFKENISSLIKISNNKSNSDDIELLTMFKQFLSSNFLKMFLTNIEKIILNYFVDISDAEKGEFQFVSDNFSIIVRFLLQPVEENFYILVNKVKQSKTIVKTTNNTQIDENTKEEKNNNYLENYYDKNTFNLFCFVLRFLMIFSMLMIVYFNLMGIELMTLVFTKKWITPTSVIILKTYCIYVAVLSINGIVDSYSTAMFEINSLKITQILNILKSILLIISNYYFIYIGYGLVSLIYSNIIANLFLITSNFVMLKLKLNSLVNLVLMRFKTILCTGIILMNIMFMKSYLTMFGDLVYIGICGIMFIFNVLLIYLLEKQVIMSLINCKILKKN